MGILLAPNSGSVEPTCFDDGGEKDTETYKVLIKIFEQKQQRTTQRVDFVSKPDLGNPYYVYLVKEEQRSTWMDGSNLR